MKKLILLFLFLFFITPAWSAPANCTYSVVNGWTQTITYQCSESVNLNGASITFTVDNPAGLTNLNSVWGFANISPYPTNPVLTLSQNKVTLVLNFTGNAVTLAAGKSSNFSYSTNNNVKVTSFVLNPAGSITGTSSLATTLSAAKPADVTATHVALSVVDSTGTSRSVNIPWAGTGTLQGLTAGTKYNLYAGALTGQKNRYTFSLVPATFTAINGVNKATMSMTATALPPTSSGLGVKGWPKYVAMGAVSDNTPATTTSLQSRPVDAIFKYGGLNGNGDPGQILYPIFDMQTAEQAKTLTNFYRTKGWTYTVQPVMVIYTANMSGGTVLTDFEYQNIVMHYITLMMETQKLQSYKTGTIILNPDFFGMIQQQNLIPQINTALSKISLQNALKTAVCFVTTTITTPYGANLTYEQLYQAIRAQKDAWSAMSIWDTYKMQYFNKCTTNPVVPFTIPTFTNNLAGWVQSTNWIIRKFGPDLSFGWQENLWSVGSANWVHTNYSLATLKSQVVDPTVAKILATSAYNGNYIPDFLAFDKYEMDVIPGAVGPGYLYNARDWDNVLNFAKLISESLGTVPIMLWQIPGGHLQQVNDIDTRNSNGSTEPDFIFGNSANPLINLKTYIKNIQLPAAIYGTTSISSYLSMDKTGKTGAYAWTTSNMQQVANSHVFAILWGGGNTTSVSTFPSNDNGWLANKIINYYKNPTPTVLTR